MYDTYTSSRVLLRDIVVARMGHKPDQIKYHNYFELLFDILQK